METLCAQEVFHCLIVTSKGLTERKANVKHFILTDTVCKGRRKPCCHCISVLSLQVVKSVLAVGCRLSVSIVKAIPLNLSVLLIAPPVDSCLPIRESLCCTVACIILIPYIIVATWKVLPVVRLWVLAIVIVQFRTLIHRILSKETCRQLHFLVDIPIPCEDGRRCEIVYNTAIALVTILITPVWIVLIIIGKPVSLVSTCTLCRTLSWVTPCRQS